MKKRYLILSIGLLIISLGIILAIIPTINNINTNIDVNTKYFKNSKVSDHIHIYGNNGWEILRSYNFCTGEGTYSDPYVIEDLEIEDTLYAIWIEDSNVYFRIENCSLSGVKSIYGSESGILLSNVSNGYLIDNECSNNDYGIKLEESINNTISENTLYANEGGAVELYSSHNNTIFGNTASSNYYNAHGMFFELSNNNTIKENTVSNIPRGGIGFSECEYNNISGNLVQNSDSGISLSFSTKNIVSRNTVNNNDLSGISLGYSSYNLVLENNAGENSRGIKLYGYGNHNNTVSGNILNDNIYGIHIESCVQNNILGNVLNDGIYLKWAHNNTFTGNLMDGLGIFMDGFLYNYIDSTNLVKGKPVYYYVNEVYLKPNNFMNAGQVILGYCNDSVIANLDISSTFNGISLYNCNNNTIMESNVNNNEYFGI
ncbi:MAG: nitrous oxide reductase family maturation protein NosD, partial [Candidatus Hodarchaeota archaeon]